MNLKRLLYTEEGKVFVSILLGLGLASLFRSACKNRKCIVFRHPEIDNINGKIFKSDNRCFKYSLKSEKCSGNKRILE